MYPTCVSYIGSVSRISTIIGLAGSPVREDDTFASSFNSPSEWRSVMPSQNSAKQSLILAMMALISSAESISTRRPDVHLCRTSAPHSWNLMWTIWEVRRGDNKKASVDFRGRWFLLGEKCFQLFLRSLQLSQFRSKEGENSFWKCILVLWVFHLAMICQWFCCLQKW